MTNITLSDGARALFLDLWNDAGNWGGTPLFGGNVGGSKQDEGYLTKLKTAGLLTTFNERSDLGDILSWIRFTEKGEALAAEFIKDTRSVTEL